MKPSRISRLAILAALAGACALGATSIPSATSGKDIFLANKCSNCHAVAAAGIARATPAPTGTVKAPPDLSTVGTRHSAALVVKFLKKEEAIGGKKHVLKFKGTDQELTVLASWLCGL